jgi:uncharacterized protein (TIGR00303 family)
MKTCDLFTAQEYPFLQGDADFLLAASLSLTCNIPGITQAGIPGHITLTPTLDAEFIENGAVYSLEGIAETPAGIPTPGLITRAVHLLSPFKKILILNLGLHSLPQHCDVHNFDIPSTPSIADAASFDAKAVFEKGRAFGRTYSPRGDYVILAESTPSGTTTAQAAAMALGIESQGLFASSFKNSPIAIKESAISASLAKLNETMSPFERLGHTADNTLLFSAGFLIEASQRFDVVLGGGTQMACALLIAKHLASFCNITCDFTRIHLATTAWIAKDTTSSIAVLLHQLNTLVKAFYTDFTFADASIPVLKCYDEGEAKEGVGAGAALAYAATHGISQQELTCKIEALMKGAL